MEETPIEERGLYWLVLDRLEELLPDFKHHSLLGTRQTVNDCIYAWFEDVGPENASPDTTLDGMVDEMAKNAATRLACSIAC